MNEKNPNLGSLPGAATGPARGLEQVTSPIWASFFHLYHQGAGRALTDGDTTGLAGSRPLRQP